MNNYQNTQRSRLRLGIVSLLGTLSVLSQAQAQQETDEAPAEATRAQVEGENEDEPDRDEPDRDGGEPEDVDDSPQDVAEEVEPEFDNQYEERADQPGGAVVEGKDVNVIDPKVTMGAGMGSNTTYAEKGVVELGGMFGLDIRERLINVSASPTVGYFIVDRFELSLLPGVQVVQTETETGDKETVVRFVGVLEPSYHLPVTDFLYVHAGLGLGLTYEEGPGVDFLLRPVLGTDLMVGRSGIFKPQFFLDVGLEDGALGGGFQGAFTVMF